MKKLIAFLLTVSMLLTMMTPCVFAANSCEVCGRYHANQSSWRFCPEACTLYIAPSIHDEYPHRWYECTKAGSNTYCQYCSAFVFNHTEYICPDGGIAWNEQSGGFIEVANAQNTSYRSPIYCTNCRYWGYHYANECNVSTAPTSIPETCDHSSNTIKRLSTWYAYNNKDSHLELYKAEVRCRKCNTLICTYDDDYFEGHYFVNGVCECGYSPSNNTHQCSNVLKSNTLYHWYECSVCGNQQAFYEHSYDSNGACVCGYINIHKCSNVLKNNDTYHWYECSVCGNQQISYEHSYASTGKCTVCKAQCSHKKQISDYEYHYEECNNDCHYFVETSQKMCATCGKTLTPYYYEEQEQHYYDKGTGECRLCGHECEHKKTRTKKYAMEYLPYNSNKHYVVTDQQVKYCSKCGVVLKVYGTKQLYDHYFQNGVCICGYEKSTTTNTGGTSQQGSTTQQSTKYVTEMKAGNLYAVSNDGHLYKRVYDASTTLGYIDQYAYTPKTSYDNFSLPTGELLIQKSGYLYDTDGNKICASVSTMLACDQRIGELKYIESRNNITKSIAVSEYQQAKQGTRTLSSIAEQKVSYKAKTGSNSSTVTTIQQKLYDLGFTSQLVTGYYGSITFNNVAYFQITNNLDVTGWVDSTTYSKLTSITANLEYLPVEVSITGTTCSGDNTITISAQGNTYCDQISITFSGNGISSTKNLYGNDVNATFALAGAGRYTITAIAYGYFTPLTACDEIRIEYNTSVSASDLEKLVIAGVLTAQKVTTDFLKAYLDTLNGATDAFWLATTYGLYAETEVYTNRDKTVVYLISRGVTDGAITLVGMIGATGSGAFAIVTSPTGAVSVACVAAMVYCGSVAISAAMDTEVVAQEMYQLLKSDPGTTGRKNMANKTDPKTGVKFDEDGFPEFESYGDVQLDPSDYMKSRPTHSEKSSKLLYEKAMKNPDIANKFTAEELTDLSKGITPDGYIWHHHQNPGLMQLVTAKAHKVWHIGGFSIWGPGN